MEKTTKKRKKSKRLKRRIGLIAVGGLSFVLTICLSVGATLAWFAGSTWASNDLYMGGPVYVEMAGRGHNGYTEDGVADGTNDANWTGGAGQLDIAASSRTSGTAAGQNANNDILLPGQKLLIYSQARVYSTLQESTVEDGAYPSQSSGADNSNTSDGTYKYYNGQGRVQTTTTSVLRAKFSINIEFDPSVGFNNFTDKTYAQGYPVQSTKYRGEYGATGTVGTPITGDTESFDEASRTAGTDTILGTADDVVTYKPSLTWQDSLAATTYTITRDNTGAITAEAGRRDAVENPTVAAEKITADMTNKEATVLTWVKGDNTKAGGAENDMWQVKYGLSKCIYKWRYVSKTEYDLAANAEYKVSAPFDGNWNTAGTESAANGGTGNGFYALYEHDGSGNLLESDAYYKARTSNYLKSYVEHYKDDYGRNLVMEIGSQLEGLENALNNSFIDLVAQSSDNIHAGNIDGFTAGDDGRIVNNPVTTAGIKASWLYVDPVIGNDTNSGDSASSVGGWWYLVKTDDNNMVSKDQKIKTIVDNVVTGTGEGTATGAASLDPDTGLVEYDFSGTKDPATNALGTLVPTDARNVPVAGTGKAAPFQRAEHKETGETEETDGPFVAATDKRILNAELYEITPNLQDKLIATSQDGNETQTIKVVSVAFPFVNGNFELPGQALTNVFANAKISFQITFQALQAFFPFTSSIDSIPSGTAITGTGKALNIGNAIPIYNEAFDYLSWL